MSGIADGIGFAELRFDDSCAAGRWFVAVDLGLHRDCQWPALIHVDRAAHRRGLAKFNG